MAVEFGIEEQIKHLRFGIKLTGNEYIPKDLVEKKIGSGNQKNVLISASFKSYFCF